MSKLNQIKNTAPHLRIIVRNGSVPNLYGENDIGIGVTKIPDLPEPSSV